TTPQGGDELAMAYLRVTLGLERREVSTEGRGPRERARNWHHTAAHMQCVLIARPSAATKVPCPPGEQSEISLGCAGAAVKAKGKNQMAKGKKPDSGSGPLLFAFWFWVWLFSAAKILGESNKISGRADAQGGHSMVHSLESAPPGMVEQADRRLG